MQPKSPTPALPLGAKLYIASICLAGLAAALVQLQFSQIHWSLQFLLYLGIALASSGMKVLPPEVNGNISVNYVFTLLGLLEFNVMETMLLAVIAAIAQTVWHAKVRPKPIQVVFNANCILLTVFIAGLLYHQPWFLGLGEQGQLLRLMLAGVGYFVVNTGSVAVVIALAEGSPIRTVWSAFYNWLFAYYLVGVSLAEMVHFSIRHLGWVFTLALLPLLYLIYRSYRLYLDKLQQQRLHAERTALLHLRTIEALAMAIEAKDECTGDHLRRVQVYSLQVAEHLGLSPEEKQALQAASILHDIGKLAVPDYIISKPGKLTPEEFDKMKIHTVVGAAILEEVGFPYAVPPIVRAHHERWDGSGYPDGLSGTDIPIGARILSAVDCFDALASDRQYRRALPRDEAMAYVASLAGTQFDPDVIAILAKNYQEFERITQETPVRESRLRKNVEVTRGAAPDAGYEQNKRVSPHAKNTDDGDFMASIALARQEVQSISELTYDLSQSLRLEVTLSLLAEKLKHLVPFDCIALYLQEGPLLLPKYVNGQNSALFQSLKIPIGQGLSGWVVETRKPIINGNPSVEPGYVEDPLKYSMLSSALSIPLGEGADQLVGALTLYNASRDAYTKDHLRIMLAISAKISRAIESALKFQNAQVQAKTDELTGLPNARSLFPHMQTEIARCAAQAGRISVLVCDLDDFKEVNDRFGHLTGNELLKQVGLILQENCRNSDYVARMGGDEFLVLLVTTQEQDRENWIHRVDQLVVDAGRRICREYRGGISVGIACYPEHGDNPESLIAHADGHMFSVKRSRKVIRQRSANPLTDLEARKDMHGQLLKLGSVQVEPLVPEPVPVQTMDK